MISQYHLQKVGRHLPSSSSASGAEMCVAAAARALLAPAALLDQMCIHLLTFHVFALQYLLSLYFPPRSNRAGGDAAEESWTYSRLADAVATMALQLRSLALGVHVPGAALQSEKEEGGNSHSFIKPEEFAVV